ncbi:MAG: hypothetical protein H0V19_04820 [Euzebyales bacterium]|nr:hypothetical protein [Euzebyales bacterium]
MLARLGAQGTGDPAGALVEARVLDGPLAELVALHGAGSPAELQRVLVIPGRRTDTLPDEACWAFGRAHGQDDSGVVESAVLAVTNHRWQKVARRLLDRLAEEGVLDGAHVDVLSTVFLEADVVPVTVPGSWLVEFYLQRRGGCYGRLDPARTFTLQRRLTPLVRRWAAARHAQTREGIARVLGRALRMDSRHGAAAILGLVDGTDGLGHTEAVEVLELAADWPSPDVRLAALQRLATRGLHSEALDRASTDRAAHIRRWATRNRQIGMAMPHGAAPRRDHADLQDVAATPHRAPVQQSLLP